MASILEFTLAEETADSIDDAGVCGHSCAVHSPLGLAKTEADDLQRFDPEAFSKLKLLGITVHDVEVEDFDAIGSLSHLPIIRSFDSRTARKLYKHAIAMRLERAILISKLSSEQPAVEDVCVAFGNEFYLF
jgi:hypothetical protein